MASINEIHQISPAVKPVSDTEKPAAPVAPEVSVVEKSAHQGKIRQEAAPEGKVVPPVGKEKESATDEQVMQALHDIKEYAQNIERDLKFDVDKGSGRLVITVIDPETDKIVRQIPPEETLHILRNLEKGGGGALFDNKV